jgi:hypothetical protein
MKDGCFTEVTFLLFIHSKLTLFWAYNAPPSGAIVDYVQGNLSNGYKYSKQKVCN